MASLENFPWMFEKDTPVLRLNHGKDRDARWVLWPVFAWRVVAPVPKQRKLNLFQRAVLGLARARVTAIGDVADRLLIAPDLAALVVVELQNAGYVDHAGEPTKPGLSMLEDIEEDPPDEARVGHVLSDAFSGKLWPRFLTGDLPIADVELNDDGWPVLLSGSAGDPWKDRTFSILPTGRDGVVVSRPGARDVLRAARRHRRQREYDEVDDDREVPQLQRVSFVDDRPQAYLLALRVCRHDSGDWMVDDPFGHGDSVDLRTRLEQRLDIEKYLRAWLAPLVGSDPIAPALGHLHIEAARKVEERLTLAIRQYESVYERLIAMQRAFFEAELPAAPLDKWDDVLVKAQVAVERTLRTVHQPYVSVNPPLFHDLDHDQTYAAKKIADAARAAGFRGTVPARLLSIRRNQVRDAERGKRGSLRSLLVLALIAARWHDDHPLRAAIKLNPELIDLLDDLATARNEAGHDNDGWPRSAHRHVDTAYKTVAILLLRH